MKKKVLIISLITIVLLILVEISSIIILKFSSKFKNDGPYFNREISCFYVYRNTPGFKHHTIKLNDKENDIIIDEYGFINSEQIYKEKPANCLRIFITGGSAAFGSGQARPYNKIIKYQTGIYSYESSIAGNLKSILQKEFPNKKIEVINACSSGRKINQNITQYLALIKDFSPDIIISIDGMNDLLTIYGNSPFAEDEKNLKERYIELKVMNESLEQKDWLATSELIKKINFNNMKDNQSKDFEELTAKLLDYDPNKISIQKYQKIKDNLTKNCDEFTDLILYYNSLCKTDNTKFVFCLQPLLYRNINKELSTSELKMKNKVNPINISLSQPELGEKEIMEMEQTGDLILRFFFDDVLSNKIDSLSKKHKFYYIDFNKEITNIDNSTEFYVDYCHLTFEANKIVAEILARKVIKILTDSAEVEFETDFY